MSDGPHSPEGPGHGSGESVSLPDWLPTSRDDFDDMVLGVVASWIVGGILLIGEEFLSAILATFDVVVSVIGILVDQFGTVGAIVGEIPLLVIGVVDGVVLTIASSAGPFAPLVVVLLWAGLVIVLLAVLREIGRALEVLPFT